MKKWMCILFVVFSLGAVGQELVLPELEEKDSLQLEMERDLMYRQLMTGSLTGGDLALPFQMPEINFDAAFAQRWSFDSSELLSGQLQVNEYFSPRFGLAPSPFYGSASVFSSAAYKLNNRFTLGGYSYGARSAFTAPFPNQGLNTFDVRGSTMFMQYKVSKNFKIETRVNVSQGPGPGF
ncbi:MAG: hypothetical protein ACOC0R_01850 [Mariniphaga sp.]